ncbi:MAG: DUF3881 family protein [Clostridiales bacterium]|nr:DUF3881 family protein [Clostridiales bacterium]
MHKFLRSVGFSNITKKELDGILQDVVRHPDMVKVTRDSEGNDFAELSRDFAPNAGITVCGSYGEDGTFTMDYYFPYGLGHEITTREVIDVEKHADKESYAGICDDLKLGVTLIFYLQNAADYLSEVHIGREYGMNGARLAGLSVDGRILIPAPVSVRQEKVNAHKADEHNQLIAQARDGDEDAIESLTLEDMDTYALLSQRVQNEDLLSIVKSTFMPYGIESDHYSILGDITGFAQIKNQLTNENLYGLTVACNGIIFEVYINEKDLLGEPVVGRRFRGSIWMQGSLCIE